MWKNERQVIQAITIVLILHLDVERQVNKNIGTLFSRPSTSSSESIIVTIILSLLLLLLFVGAM